MRTTRALIAGLGTTGSLVAAAACVFLVTSALIAFKGWPGAGFTDRIDNLFVRDQQPVTRDQPGTAAVAAGAGVASAAVAASAAGPTFGTPGTVLGNNGSARRGGTVRLPGGTLVSTGPRGPGTVSAPSTSSQQGGGGGSVSVPQVDTGPTQNGLADTVQNTGGSAGDTVRQTTGNVGNSVGGPAGDTVTNTGDTVGDTVDNTTQAVGDVLPGGG